MKTALTNAIDLIAQHINLNQQSQYVPLHKARGRKCAMDIYAKHSIPPYDISLRDGMIIPQYALERQNLSIKNLIAISTGGKVPDDCMYIIESEKIVNDSISPRNLDFSNQKSNFIKPKGEDIKKGDLLIKQGTTINAFDVANLATQGISQISVYKKPNIAYVGIGNELIDIQKEFSKDKIYNSNAYAIATRSESFGANIGEIVCINDNITTAKETLLRLKNSHDIIITIGGVSRNNSIGMLLLEDFFNVIFSGVALAPAGLSAFSFLGDTPILHLPGLPMSALLGFEILGLRLIYRYYGQDYDKKQIIMTPISQHVQQSGKSQSIIPGFFNGSEFAPIRARAGMMNILNRCNGYILPETDKDIATNQIVEFYPFVAWNN